MKKTKNLLDHIFIILFAIQIIVISVSNLTMIDKNLDSDAARLLYHIMMMAKENKILIPDWSYATTLGLDCTTLFALPLYKLTGNIYLSCGLSNILLTALFVLIIFFLFDGKPLTYPLLALNFLLIPYSFGWLDYYNMLFYSYTPYIMKILLPLLLAALILYIRRNLSGKLTIKYFAMTGVYSFLTFLTAFSSGWYVLLCGLFPIITVWCAYKFFKKERVTWRELLPIILTIFLNVVGSYFNGHIWPALGNKMLLRTSLGLWDYLGSCFASIFEVFGGYTHEWTTRALSKAGLTQLLKLVLSILFYGSIYISIKKLEKKPDNLFLLTMVSIPLWNFFVLCAVYTTYGSDTFEYRYHLMGAIPAVCLFSYLVAELMEKMEKWQKRTLCAGISLIVLYLTVVCFEPVFTPREITQQLQSVVDYVQDRPESVVYFYSDRPSSEICRILEPSKEYFGITEDGECVISDYYEKYSGAPIQADDYLLIINYNVNPWQDLEELNLFGHTFKRIVCVYNNGIFEITE